MNYSTDKPIKNEKEDLLGRSLFSKQLGKAIYDYNSKDGLVIGLFGKWGTGKTSIINMAMNEIENLSSKNGNQPLIMRFVPWNYSDKNDLISLFFRNLKNKINIKDNTKLKEQIGEAIDEYSDACDLISLIPTPWAKFVAPITKSTVKLGSKFLKEAADLETSKNNLEDKLIKLNKKIIVVIDDIDRLTNSQIRDIVQLVKQVADFPNIIYLLVMDREIVSNALSEAHNIDGNEYLEKIIQVPFEIPELRKEKLNNIFFTKLNQIVNELPNGTSWDKDYWGEVFTNCIEPYINTLRDVNRVINTFQFKYETVYQETSFEDMISLTTLEVMQPKLYKWIGNNKEAVCGGFMHGFLSNNRDKKEHKKFYYDEFEKLGLEPEKAMKCISTMFPVFAEDIDDYRYGRMPKSGIRSRMRVADSERYYLYFMFDLDDIKVSRSIINDCIYNLDTNNLESIIHEITIQGNIGYFVDELSSLKENIPYERICLIARVLLNVQNSIIDGTPVMDPFSARDRIGYLVFDLIKGLKSEEERYSIIESELKNSNKYKLGAIARIINTIEHAYGRLSSAQNNFENQIIGVDKLEELEKIFVSKSLEVIKLESISDIEEFKYIFYLLEHFDKDRTKEYIDELFKNDVDKLKFVCSMAGRWNGISGSGWNFYQDNYKEYMSKDEIYTLIQNFDKNKLDSFTEIEQIKLASFVLNFNADEMDRVNEEKASELLAKWKENKE